MFPIDIDIDKDIDDESENVYVYVYVLLCDDDDAVVYMLMICSDIVCYRIVVVSFLCLLTFIEKMGKSMEV
jgi:hypothetical protein